MVAAVVPTIPPLPMSPNLRLLPRWVAAVLLTALGAPAIWATSVTPPSFDELANGADYVVRARVTAVEAVATPRAGKRPRIHTRVTLEVIETIAGTPPSPLVLTMLGGKVGDDEMRVEGVPEFSVGDEDVLFVAGNGRNFFPLYAVMHGRYRIKRDAAGREFVARSNDVPMSDVAEVAQPLTAGGAAELQKKFKARAAALTPADFAAQIRNARREK